MPAHAHRHTQTHTGTHRQIDKTHTQRHIHALSHTHAHPSTHPPTHTHTDALECLAVDIHSHTAQYRDFDLSLERCVLTSNSLSLSVTLSLSRAHALSISLSRSLSISTGASACLSACMHNCLRPRLCIFLCGLTFRVGILKSQPTTNIQSPTIKQLTLKKIQARHTLGVSVALPLLIRARVCALYNPYILSQILSHKHPHIESASPNLTPSLPVSFVPSLPLPASLSLSLPLSYTCACVRSLHTRPTMHIYTSGGSRTKLSFVDKV